MEKLEDLQARLDLLLEKREKIIDLGGNIPSSMDEDIALLEKKLKRIHNDSDDLENQFLKELKLFENAVAPHLKILNEEFNKIIELSNKSGIPIDIGFSPIKNEYSPHTFKDKWEKLDNDFLQNNNIYGHHIGWYYSTTRC